MSDELRKLIATSTDVSPLPWRRGGQVSFVGDEVVELPFGTDIWDANGEPVTELHDYFRSPDVDLIPAAVNALPGLLDRIEALESKCALLSASLLKADAEAIELAKERDELRAQLAAAQKTIEIRDIAIKEMADQRPYDEKFWSEMEDLARKCAEVAKRRGKPGKDGANG